MWIQSVCVPLDLWGHDVCATDHLWTNPMSHVQRTNSMGIVYTKEQSYGDMMHVTRNLMHEQRTNSMGQCMYMYLCTVSSEGSMSSMKDQLYRNSTCTKSSCQKEYLYRG